MLSLKRFTLGAVCLAAFAPLSALAQHSSKNVTQAAHNYLHRKKVRAARSVKHEHAVFKRYTHRKRAHIKHYLDTH